MGNGVTELVFILDRSSSMEGLEGDTVEGFNAMLEKQRSQPGACLVSTVLFDSHCQLLHDRIPLQEIPPMTVQDYSVRGCTALIDAIGGAIDRIAQAHEDSPEEERPEHTVFVITTDGMENASCSYDADRVRRMIKKRRKTSGWEFLFLGANIDAVSTAGSFGIRESRAAEYVNDSRGICVNYEAISEAISRFRRNVPVTKDWKHNIEKDHSGRN